MDKYLIIVGAIFMIHIVLLIHELGHLVVGLIQGFRFELLIIGLLGVKRVDGRIKVYFNKNIGYYGGVAATSPRDDSKDNPKKFAKVLLAGPIASILFAMICFMCAILIENSSELIFYTGGITSIAIFLVTTIPSQTGMFFTDRKRYQRLVTPGKDQEIELAMLSIMAKFTKDNSYQNIDKEEIETLISDDTLFVQYYGLFNMICWEIEHKGQIENSTKQKYEAKSKKISKSIVTAFNKEIEKYSEKFKANIC